MKIKILVAFDLEGGIGKNNKLPWNLKSDLQFFKHMTTGKTIVMGYNTFESIGKPLSGRMNLVMTSKDFFVNNHCYTMKSIDSVLDYCVEFDIEELYVIGGESIYREFLKPEYSSWFSIEIYASIIQGSFDCDRFFPLDELRKYRVELLNTYHESDSDSHSFQIFKFL